MPNRKLGIRPLSGALGAELTGVELARELDDATVAAIREALLEHCVVFFRDQDLNVEQHKRLAHPHHLPRRGHLGGGEIHRRKRAGRIPALRPARPGAPLRQSPRH